MVTEACLALAAEVRTGVAPARALAAAAESFPELLGPAANRAGVGGDVPAALRVASAAPGSGALLALAAAWQVCERSGAGLADVLAATADSLRAEEGVRQEAGAQLAAVRATARLLAVLPVLTLLVLSGGGGAPLAFLLGTPVGAACLIAGAGLAVVGLVWVERMARSATRSSWSTD